MTELMRSLLFEVEPMDPLVLGVVSVLLHRISNDEDRRNGATLYADVLEFLEPSIREIPLRPREADGASPRDGVGERGNAGDRA